MGAGGRSVGTFAARMRPSGRRAGHHARRKPARLCHAGLRREDNMKTGLVLEGGGMRGIYTAGVLDAMYEAGLRAAFNGVIGVSAGAVHGCSFVSGQRGRSIRYFTRYCRDRGFMSVYSLLT